MVNLIVFFSHQFLVLKFIFQGHGLKKRKFVIQWRKFEAKKRSRNEVMIYKVYRFFLDFILIFQEFFGSFKSIKNHKKGFYMQLTCAELTWHNMNMW